MLSFDQVKQNYPKEAVRRNPKAVLVEYLQYELIDSVFKQPGSELLSFMGGTAIRIAYHSSRFSEDLDFDNFGLTYGRFEDMFKKVIKDMRAKGFEIEFKFVERGAYHCYIKFPDLLSINNLTSNQEEKILVRIDAVSKKRIFKPRLYVLNGFDVYRNILVNPAQIILAQKLQTIIERKREKGRDIYDVSYLLGFSEPDYGFLKKEYGLGKEVLRNKLLKKISNLDMDELAKEVLPFLIKPDDQERILSFRQYIKQKL